MDNNNNANKKPNKVNMPKFNLNNPTLLRIDSKAGHGAGKPMAKVLEEQADIYGFIMYNLGMKPKF